MEELSELSSEIAKESAKGLSAPSSRPTMVFIVAKDYEVRLAGIYASSVERSSQRPKAIRLSNNQP